MARNNLPLEVIVDDAIDLPRTKLAADPMATPTQSTVGHRSSDGINTTRSDTTSSTGSTSPFSSFSPPTIWNDDVDQTQEPDPSTPNSSNSPPPTHNEKRPIAETQDIQTDDFVDPKRHPSIQSQSSEALSETLVQRKLEAGILGYYRVFFF